MRIVAIPDVHGSAGVLHRVAAAGLEADVLVLVGDVADAGPAEWETVRAAAEAVAPRLVAVPGNMDDHAVLAHMQRLGHSVHGAHLVVDGVAFLGVGGALPFFGPMELTEEEIAACLERASRDLPGELPWVVVSHQPPLDTAVDVLRNGRHVGSSSLRAFIEEHEPLLCLSGHVHESVASDSLGATRLLNSGPPGRTGLVSYAEIVDGELRLAELRPF